MDDVLVGSLTDHLADTSIPNNYFKLYPTVHLGYELSDHTGITLSYSKRVNRPDADELNPNPEYAPIWGDRILVTRVHFLVCVI